MNFARNLDVLIYAESYAWIFLIVAVYVGGARRETRLRKGGLRTARLNEAPPSYRALVAFAGIRFAATLLYPVFIEWQPPFGLTPYATTVLYYCLFWTFYVSATITLFFFIEGLIKNSLKPLPGLSSAAVMVFRWASVVALVIALTAHLPSLAVMPFHSWIDEVSYSFMVCVCSFEITLIGLLLARLRRLGMCLRSRPVGFGLGLTMIGCMDLITAATTNIQQPYLRCVLIANQVAVLTAISIWIYYIILPEPLRNPHSLSPASRLMKWNEIALKLELNGKQAETVPFISGVESIVVGIMKKHNIGNHS